MIRFIDIALNKKMSFDKMHVTNNFLIKAANGLIDFRSIAIEQLRERGLDENGSPLLNSDLFEESELEAELTWAERNSLCTRDDVIDILNSCMYPNWFIRQNLNSIIQYIMNLKNQGYDNEYIKLCLRDNPKEFLGDFHK